MEKVFILNSEELPLNYRKIYKNPLKYTVACKFICQND